MARLDRLLARNLACARHRATDLIDEGGVTDQHGQPLTDARRDIPDADLPLTVQVDGQPLRLYDQAYVLLNKPAGCVTALHDKLHPVAYNLLQTAPLFADLRAVGRLDLDTTGLLLWTTDGGWLHRLTHPRRAVPRTYQAALARPYATPPNPLVLDDGHRPHIVHLGALAADRAHPSLVLPNGPHVLVEITIVGGAYHEVRRIFAALGSHVSSLCRVRFGALALPHDLPMGKHRVLSGDEATLATVSEIPQSGR